MVWRLCLRVLDHVQDAEDAFQATFLVLARKAATVVKRESLGSFLYGVAYRIAREAKAINARRRAREKQVEEIPDQEVMPAEVQDWRPWLDRELNLLPEHYRAVIVACDLEGRSRKEAARHLGLSEGTVSSRLARGRCLLAKRLSRYGLSLSGGALAAALAEGAHLPSPLLSSTTKAAVGQAALSITVDGLVKGAMKTMLLAKLKVAAGAVIVVVALGASGLMYRASGQSAPTATAQKSENKPRSELEALRRENELLKLNLEVVLEKVRAQEAELRTLKAQAGQPRGMAFSPDGRQLYTWELNQAVRLWDAATGKQLSKAGALPKADQSAPNKEELRRTLDALEKAVKDLREQLKKLEGRPAGK
jgi:RNA polymerase sigma factor (sigma-70 family)